MKTFSMKLAATGLLVTSFVQPVFAKSNLWEVYKQALKNDPTILAQEMGMKATEERVEQSFAGLLPTITANYQKSLATSEGQFNV
ncbi:MAG: TolC family protein, partial [Kangiellaceae bacterium]|nr:TolC family protein [Kangiellaceae bacterium]